MLYTKDEAVKYTTNGQVVRAIVRTVHRDGTRTVEAQHFLDEEGRSRGPYLGFKYRLNLADLRYSV